jgi:hypothetical protein
VDARDPLFERVVELHVQQAARAIAEARYLDGHDALFPDTAQAWPEQVHQSGKAAVLTFPVNRSGHVTMPGHVGDGPQR